MGSECEGIFGGEGFYKTGWSVIMFLVLTFDTLWALLSFFELIGVTERVYFNLIWVSCTAGLSLLSIWIVAYCVQRPALKKLTKAGVDRDEFIKVHTALHVAHDARISLIITALMFILLTAVLTTEALIPYPYGYLGTSVIDSVRTYLPEVYDSAPIKAYVTQKAISLLFFVISGFCWTFYFVPFNQSMLHFAKVYAYNTIGAGSANLEGAKSVLRLANPAVAKMQMYQKLKAAQNA